MVVLYLFGIEDSVDDVEIGEFLCRYGFPEFHSIVRIPAEGGTPVAILRFDDVQSGMLNLLLPRIQNVFWKGSTVTAHVLPERI